MTPSSKRRERMWWFRSGETNSKTYPKSKRETVWSQIAREVAQWTSMILSDTRRRPSRADTASLVARSLWDPPSRPYKWRKRSLNLSQHLQWAVTARLPKTSLWPHLCLRRVLTLSIRERSWTRDQARWSPQRSITMRKTLWINSFCPLSSLRCAARYRKLSINSWVSTHLS